MSDDLQARQAKVLPDLGETIKRLTQSEIGGQLARIHK